jgi:tetratricopeptide (TPR) repeat protein
MPLVAFVIVLACWPLASASDSLITIAEREAARERAAHEKDVKNVIAELGIADNPQLAYVSDRIGTLVKIGPAAVPYLIEAIRSANGDVDGVRRANNSARALGAILKTTPDATANGQLQQLAAEGTTSSRAAAMHAIGLAGDASAMPMLEAALTGSQVELAAAAATALGNLGHPAAGELLLRALSRPEEDLRRVVVRSLTQVEYAPALSTLLDLLTVSELGDTRFAILQLAAKVGAADSIDKLGKFVDTPAPGGLREAAIDAMREIGKRGKNSDKAKAITALSRVLENAAQNLSEKAALALHALGDDRGLDQVVDDDTRTLRNQPKNVMARMSRARKYYQFQRYKEAIKDCRTALEGQRGSQIGSINALLAACFAGLQDYGTAKRHLEKAEVESVKTLLAEYPELAEMAKDPKYSKLFEK